jgi:DNA-binding response OmpR family regulator
VKRWSILLVEDDDDVSAMLVERLVEAGYQVDVARNGAEGLRRLRQRAPPKLILLDWSMPIMSGPDMLAAMQSQPAWNGLPVVLITAHDDAKLKALALRASGYLKKPIDSDDLLRMVSALVREHTSLCLRRASLERNEMERATGSDRFFRN